MNPVDAYLEQVRSCTRLRGSARRRLLDEYRDHLLSASEQVGVEEAVRRFGPAPAVAAAYDAEVTDRRATRAAVGAVVAVVAVAASTLALVNSTASGAAAVPVWAAVCFGAAQLSAGCTLLVVLQLAAMRRQPTSSAAAVLLVRRAGWSIGFAGLTFFAAGAALTGSGSPVLLLAGPAVAALAAVVLARTGRLVRRVGAGAPVEVRPPLADIAAATRLRLPAPGPLPLVGLTSAVAALAALGWALGERDAAAAVITVALGNGLLVVATFLVLGRTLGLRGPLRASGGT